MIALTVPDTWSYSMITRVALKLYDVVFLLGCKVTRTAYWRQFCPGGTEESADRSWERFKRSLRRAGVVFTSTFDPRGLEDSTLEFESRDYVNAVVDSLIGPGEPIRHRNLTRNVFDFFPGIEREEVEDLFALSETS